jgi:hypothetical protein
MTIKVSDGHLARCSTCYHKPRSVNISTWSCHKPLRIPRTCSARNPWSERDAMAFKRLWSRAGFSGLRQTGRWQANQMARKLIASTASPKVPS